MCCLIILHALSMGLRSGEHEPAFPWSHEQALDPPHTVRLPASPRTPRVHEIGGGVVGILDVSIEVDGDGRTVATVPNLVTAPSISRLVEKIKT